MPARSLFDLSPEELGALVKEAGEKPYRVTQILNWAYRRLASSFGDMSDLPIRLRGFLAETILYSRLELYVKEEGGGDWAKRYLWAEKGRPVCESVLLKYRYGLAGCVSVQVGCPVGCVFCASGLLGFERNLTKGEIVEEFMGMCRDQGERLGHLVFMGTGEPFLNYEAVLSAIDALCDPARYGMSRRKVTVSTVGVPEAMRRYAADCGGARLALSLHAADDATRSELIPMNKRYPVASVVGALRDFAEATGQRVTVEYMLLSGVNDSPSDAKRLGDLLGGIDCVVNLIPWNEVPGMRWRTPSRSTVEGFREVLVRNHMKVTVRRKLGSNIEGACGQLRRKAGQEKSKR